MHFLEIVVSLWRNMTIKVKQLNRLMIVFTMPNFPLDNLIKYFESCMPRPLSDPPLQVNLKNPTSDRCEV